MTRYNSLILEEGYREEGPTDKPRFIFTSLLEPICMQAVCLIKELSFCIITTNKVQSKIAVLQKESELFYELLILDLNKCRSIIRCLWFSGTLDRGRMCLHKAICTTVYCMYLYLARIICITTHSYMC